MSYALVTVAQCVSFIHLIAYDKGQRNEITMDIIKREVKTFDCLNGTIILAIYYWIFLVINADNLINEQGQKAIYGYNYKTIEDNNKTENSGDKNIIVV